MNAIVRAIAVVAALAALPAQAVFHLWEISELFSNADGTVQFIELRALAGGQQFLAGHAVTTTGSTGTRSFTFPADLPGDTSGKRMLIGTTGFAALGVVTPDYVVPNGFLFRAGGSVNFAGVDNVNHGALPTDNRSIDRNGFFANNSPTNFAGQTGTVALVAPPPLNFQGLWYRGEIESGWGVNLAHQGNILFVTWFTYDSDGSQMWLVGPDVRRTTGDTFTGALYRTTGPAFNSVPFNPAMIGAIPVGTATFSFTDASNGTFAYTVSGVSQTKPIVRQVFATVPTCTSGGTPGSNLNFSNLWYASPAESESGWGVNVTHQSDILFATWFTYEASGRGMWIVAPRMDRTTGNTYTGPLFRTTGPAFNANPWNPAGVVVTPAGTATFAFTSADAGSFTYTLNNITQTKAITTQRFSTPTYCR